MKLYDISLEISNKTVVWPGDPSVKLELTSLIEKGATCNVSKLEMGVHTATHIDAPFHYIQEGNTVDQIPIEKFIGKCLVIEIKLEELKDTLIEKDHIAIYDLDKYSKVLIKTENSKLLKEKTFNKSFISLALSAAEYLIEKNIELIGIDYLSIESYTSKNHIIHKRLLENKIIILEGLNLLDINPGEYELICLPLKLSGTDGAPARVVLRG